MATQTPKRSEDFEHGEIPKKPLFGPGSGREDSAPDRDTTPAGKPSDPRDEYDPQTSPKMDPSDPRGDKVAGKDSLERAEQAGADKADASAAKRKEADKIAGWRYKPSDQSGFMGRLRAINWRSRKSITTIIVTTVLAGGGIFTFNILQGPLQLVHLSQILQKNLFNQEENSDIRFRRLVRFYRSGGDVGETRVGYLASKTFHKTTAQLKEVGFEFGDRDANGRPRTFEIDIDNKKSPYNGMSLEKALRNIKKDHNLPDDASIRKRGSKFIIDLDLTKSRGIKLARSLSYTSVGALSDGKIATGMKHRSLKRFYGLPSLFHPISKAQVKQETKLAKKADRKKAKQERDEPRRKANAGRIAAAHAALKSKANKWRHSIAGALVTTAVVCMVRDVADAAIYFNYVAIVVPSIIEATDKEAVGAQVQSGNDIFLAQAGAEAESFVDEETGETIWKAKSLDALASGGAGSGEDMPPEYAQAFFGATTADNLKSIADVNLLGISLGGVACSPVGQAAQIALSIVALVATIPTGGASLGAWAALQGAKEVAAAAVINLVQKILTNAVASKPLPDLINGPLGGNVLAYGARAGANTAARASGGVALGGTESETFVRGQEEQSRREFASKNFFSRIFDVHDYRSLASRVIDKSSTDPAKNMSTIANSFASLPSRLFALASPHIMAAEGAGDKYNWGFPIYGMPYEIMDDKNFDDPYENATRAARILNSPDGEDYIEKARKCFGVEISKGTGGWDAIAEEDVYPNDKEYLDANCNNLGDGNWKVIMLWVFDTRLMTSVACFDGDTATCANLEIDTSTTSTSPADSGGTVSGNVQDLAKTLLELAQQGKIILGHNDFGNDSADRSNPDENVEDLAAGKQAHTTQVRTCTDGAVNAQNATTPVSANVLKFLVDLAQSGHTVRVNALAGQCHSATSNHYKGIAVDLDCGNDPGKSVLDQFANKYGGANNGEVCPGDAHYHYDF